VSTSQEQWPIEQLLPYMKDLESIQNRLGVLGQQWDLLTILGQMSGTGTDMSQTRNDFNQLTEDLVKVLAREVLKKNQILLSFKSQVAVDIVIRNLFERTADIGFLATDFDVQQYLAHPENRDLKLMRDRFKEYVLKYSVYDDIILLDTEGGVLCRLDDSQDAEFEDAHFLNEVRTTKAAFVEYFGPSHIGGKHKNSLIYAFRVQENLDPESPCLGILCLKFKFEDELKKVYSNLLEKQEWTVLALVDKDKTVISSSDPLQVPCGSTIESNPQNAFDIIHHGGRAYMVKLAATNGYQGFMGLGWMGCALIPLEHAFDQTHSQASNQLKDPNLLAAISRNEGMCSQEILNISEQAEIIQDELDRTVWNGNLPNGDQMNENQSRTRKVLLREISETGNKTKNVFQKSIEDLYNSVLQARVQDVEYAAALAIDIMDRNLYERANDCRWWALTSAFRTHLSEAHLSDDVRQELENILVYINGLYTVYTNLFLFDRNGNVIAVSNPSERNLLDKTIPEELRSKIMSLNNSQQYAVSSFSATPLYSNNHTYIYGASILSASNGQAVGGIGIVFDSEPQLKQMLVDALPATHQEDFVGVFIDKNMHIISSSSSQYSVGSKLNVNLSYETIRTGKDLPKVLRIENNYYTVGVKRSHGYREFKGPQDAYKEEIAALVLNRIGDAGQGLVARPSSSKPNVSSHAIRSGSEPYVEIATFAIGTYWLGIMAHDVVEAIKATSLKQMWGENSLYLASSGEKVIFAIDPRAYFDKAFNNEREAPVQVVILKVKDGVHVGLIVDRLGDIQEVEEARFDRKIAMQNVGATNFVMGVVKPLKTQKESILLTIDPLKFVDAMTTQTADGSLVAKIEEYMKQNPAELVAA
jgi:chemotaxis signal transduction protein/predicted nucleic-acid-binding Zn-ribbon protein